MTVIRLQVQRLRCLAFVFLAFVKILRSGTTVRCPMSYHLMIITPRGIPTDYLLVTFVLTVGTGDISVTVSYRVPIFVTVETLYHVSLSRGAPTSMGC